MTTIEDRDADSAVTLDIADGVATVTLNRPDVHNGLSLDMADGLLDLTARISEDAGVRAVLIVGAGPVFSVGGDVSVFASVDAAALPDTLGEMASRYHDAVLRLANLDVPVVCAVHRAAAGAALGLVCVSDVVLAAEGTKFAMGFGRIGLTGDGGTSWFLPRLIGTRRAAEMYFEDRVLDAGEAADLGLITRVVPADQLAEQARDVARRMASGPTRAYGTMRALLHASADSGLGAQLDRETDSVRRIAGTRDAAHGFASFVGKTRPSFEGR